MQTLEYDNKEKNFELPEGLEGVKVVVDKDYHNNTVILSYESCSISLSMEGARELALTLRQAANKIEKESRARQWIK